MVRSMSWSRKQSRPDSLAQTTAPIKYLTENGFSIIRLSDIDSSVVNTPRECKFLVQDERGVEREIKVNLSQDLITRIRLRRRGALSDKSVLAGMRGELSGEVSLGRKRLSTRGSADRERIE